MNVAHQAQGDHECDDDRAWETAQSFDQVYGVCQAKTIKACPIFDPLRSILRHCTARALCIEQRLSLLR